LVARTDTTARQMGLVSQDCLLFQGTLEDNIRYGCEGASLRDVVAAAKAAHAHDFITAMPQVGVFMCMCACAHVCALPC
jgi:ABC-type multidrug transport system fused ATPase/permease subunit